MIFWTPNTSCKPAATRNKTAAGNTPPTRMLANADTAKRSNLELGGLDPLPEICSRGLLQIGCKHGLEITERHKVVAIIMSGEPLHEGLLGDMVLAPRALATEAFDRKARQRIDDIVLGGPVAVLRPGRSFDRRLVGGEREIGAVRLPFRVIVIGLGVPGHELLGERRGIRVGKIKRIVSEQHALRREFLLHQGVLPAGGW